MHQIDDFMHLFTGTNVMCGNMSQILQWEYLEWMSHFAPTVYPILPHYMGQHGIYSLNKSTTISQTEINRISLYSTMKYFKPSTNGKTFHYESLYRFECVGAILP